jgi:hypothetical protein
MRGRCHEKVNGRFHHGESILLSFRLRTLGSLLSPNVDHVGGLTSIETRGDDRSGRQPMEVKRSDAWADIGHHACLQHCRRALIDQIADES